MCLLVIWILLWDCCVEARSLGIVKRGALPALPPPPAPPRGASPHGFPGIDSIVEDADSREPLWLEDFTLNPKRVETRTKLKKVKTIDLSRKFSVHFLFASGKARLSA